MVNISEEKFNDILSLCNVSERLFLAFSRWRHISILCQGEGCFPEDLESAFTAYASLRKSLLEKTKGDTGRSPD